MKLTVAKGEKVREEPLAPFLLSFSEFVTLKGYDCLGGGDDRRPGRGEERKYAE